MSSSRPSQPGVFTPQRLGSLRFSQGNASTLSLSPRTRPKRRPFPVNDTTFDSTYGGGETEMEDEEEWTMLDRMRCWRNDAIGQHLYETARFWGDQICDMSGDANDAFWLAQVHYLMRQYSHAYSLLSSIAHPKRGAPPMIHPVSDPIPQAATQTLNKRNRQHPKSLCRHHLRSLSPNSRSTSTPHLRCEN
ncbi:hypothetical protein BT69DRAFT_111332 [Atractiella rhizophila]|nr:hypothetical protein BT69DRAFT_111332 [Atractiella rhizophila]